MIIKVIYNGDLHAEFIKDLTEALKDFPNLKVEVYDAKFLKDRKQAFKVKGSFSARLDPFVGIYSDNIGIRGFYSEASECTVNNIVNYLNSLVMQVKIVNISTNDLPKYETPASAGLDVRADFSRISAENPLKLKGDGEIVFAGKYHPKTMIRLEPGTRVLIPTGLSVGIPEGYEIQVRPRSGLALKKGLTVLNTPGTVDADYTGEVGVILINQGSETVWIEDGERIAQFVLNKVEHIEWNEVNKLDTTERGAGGFGHSGVK